MYNCELLHGIHWYTVDFRYTVFSGCLSHLGKNKSKQTNQMQAILKMSPSMVNMIRQFGSSFFYDGTSNLTWAVSRMVHNINIIMICCIVLVHAWIPFYHLNQLIELYLSSSWRWIRAFEYHMKLVTWECRMVWLSQSTVTPYDSTSHWSTITTHYLVLCWVVEDVVHAPVLQQHGHKEQTGSNTPAPTPNLH